jgi:4-hydroxy-3-methylbut-2-enyl diphosphate reductase
MQNNIMRFSSRPLNVLLANPRGFCAGVIRAIDIVERALDLYGAPVYVRHEIVHNRHVVERLRGMGAVFVEELDEIPPNMPTIFSAHGVARTVQEDAAARELPVLDATCPLVTKVHVQGRRYAKAGRTIILIGHAGHAEVIGTMGQIEAPIHLVSTAEEVATLPLAIDTPISYITQTTLSVDDTRGVIAALNARFTDVEGPDIADICYATQNRQTAVRDLARQSDLLIVVGARNSSNSSRLREIGDEMGVPSYLVDDGEGVDPAWLDGVETVGVTAGASAPEKLVESVIAAIAAVRPVSVRPLDGVQENIEFALPSPLRQQKRAK